MTYPDPAAFGDFRVNAVPKFTHCPQCGTALDWAMVEESDGHDAPPRFHAAEADCGCGLGLTYRPNAAHLRQARRHRAAMRFQDDEEAGQGSFL